MALFFHLRSLKPSSLTLPLLPLLPRRRPLPAAAGVRLLSFATPEEAAAERRRRKRRLRIEPPLSHRPQPQQQRIPKPQSNPNAPKLPEPVSALAGNRLNLHNRILTLIRENDLDEAALLTRHSIYSNCRPTAFTCNAVLNALLRQARYADLLSLHRFITQASVAPTVVTHNLLLQAYCDCRKTDIALEHFRLLLKDDSPVLPSPTTYRILAKGLVDNSKLDQAVELKDGMLEKGFVAPDPLVYNFLMGGFVRANEPEKVISLFEELKEKLGGGMIYDGTPYGNLMKAYFMKGMEEEAMVCYSEVLGEGSKVRFGAVSYNSVLDALGRHGKLDDAIKLFDRMIKEHDPPRRIAVNLGSFNVMVVAFCIAGRFNDAIKVFGEMGERKCTPDTLSYNNLIDQLGKNQLVGQAEEFDEMKELLEGALRKVGREEDIAKMYEDVEREKAERAARAAEEKARAEALAREEEERKKAEAAAKEAAAARASQAAIEAVLGRRKEAAKEESPDGGSNPEDGGILKRLGIANGPAEEKRAENGNIVGASVGNESVKQDGEAKEGAGSGGAADQATAL
ncbi:Pentatricopeptide repeat-containing protein [Ananas comosus]|uniref:Pentatricopeptide repeat-containing protein n=1 Tax=Ananas comosus TaxID=4615 RepID=A0A199UVD3_ANACO|nr:Pentatricopeptide repeat-containing protein [Ananas comosus]